MNLSELRTGQTAIIVRVHGSGQFRKRILEMGFVQGKRVTVVHNAPLFDPIYYKILDYNVSLRRMDATQIEVELVDAEVEDVNADDLDEISSPPSPDMQHMRRGQRNHSESLKTIRVALVGNPNCGKTCLFNQASGAHEHVGNYSGVTVEAKTGYIYYRDYRVELIDLPGAYSISPYSPEEVYIREYLTGENRPDIVLDVVDTCNLERNLYLTLQLKEMNLPIVVALNMFDEFVKRDEPLDYPQLAQLMGTPMIPTVCRTGLGLQALFDEVISLWEGIQAQDPKVVSEETGKIRTTPINYGSVLEPELKALEHKVQEHLQLPSELNHRFVAVALMEQDKYMEELLLNKYARGAFIISARNYALKQIEERLGDKDTETVITDSRYGFIAGALRTTYRPKMTHQRNTTDKIDHIVTHRFLGFPIFLLLMFLMFECTFILGQYPMDWIEAGVGLIGNWVSSLLPDGSFKSLLVDGVIAGVGGVVVFLPNILILYFFISIFEDTGYMSRAAFIMDKIMHRMGLHGKSFIPLIMGFGCNVPAVMSTRTIESRKSRIITMLVLPFMSCSARLPVYLLLAGALFPQSTGLVLFGLYLFGIIIAVVSARILRGTYFRGEDIPFVMELPPYRLPTVRSILIHMWSKAKQYLHKMGTVILFASVLVWFLGYFPRNAEREAEVEAKTLAIKTNPQLTDKEKADSIALIEHHMATEHQENSFIGRIGKASEPIIAPLGFDWKMGVSIFSGLAAKEVVVSTLGVIYQGDADDSQEAVQELQQRIKMERRADGSPSFTPLVAIGFMLFVLIYFPCVATIIAISRESGSWLWGLFSVLYSCGLAWLVAFLVHCIGQWLFL